jgi:23S rRNA (guanosine2251-2'-O)-methyltransferase
VKHLSSFHAILETLRAGSAVGTLYVTAEEHRRGPRIREILEEAGRRSTTVLFVPESKLSEMSPGHRGILLAVESELRRELSLEALCERASQVDASLVFVLDHIEDPHNVGAILRSADAFGVDAVIIPARRASPLTDAAARSSAGASAWMPVIQVSNLRAAVDALKGAGYWVYAADMEGAPVGGRPMSKKALVVLGNEGKGASRILREAADESISISMRGHVDSLNVSVSAAILMYEYRRTCRG